jgi:uncharacterized protein (DUF779 family)
MKHRGCCFGSSAVGYADAGNLTGAANVLGGPSLTDTVEKVPKCLLAISLKETKLSYARQLIRRPGSGSKNGCD